MPLSKKNQDALYHVCTEGHAECIEACGLSACLLLPHARPSLTCQKFGNIILQVSVEEIVLLPAFTTGNLSDKLLRLVSVTAENYLLYKKTLLCRRVWTELCFHNSFLPPFCQCCWKVHHAEVCWFLESPSALFCIFTVYTSPSPFFAIVWLHILGRNSMQSLCFQH